MINFCVFNHRNNNPNVIIGNARKRPKITTSEIKRGIKIINPIRINTDLIAIPIPLENPTKPFLYSFFKGLKNVFKKSGSEDS